VESAQEAVEAVEEAEATVREEVREQGGSDSVEAEAVAEEIHQEAEEVREEVPVQQVPTVNAEEEIAQEVAASVTPAEEKPALIPPEADHWFYKKRKVFGKSI
jgi:hypothetical protein